jgi:hypothetical protein
VTFKAATCPSCGGALQLPDDRATVKCMYCGVDVIVREAIQAAAIGNVDNWLKIARTAARAGNHQEAYEYFTRVLEVNADNIEAWFGKGEAAGMMSLPENFRLPEMMTTIEHAISHTPDDRQESAKKRAAGIIDDTTANHYRILRQKIPSVLGNEQAWADYIHQVRNIVGMLEQAHEYNPTDPDILHGVISVCRDNLTGVSFVDPHHRDYKNRPLVRRRMLSPGQQDFMRGKILRYTAALRQMNPTYLTPSLPDTGNGIWASFAAMVGGLHKKGILPSFVTSEAVLVLGILSLFFVCGLIAVIQEKGGQRKQSQQLQSATSQPTASTSSTPAIKGSTDSVLPAEHLALAKKALADGYKPNKDPAQTNWGRVTDARRELEAITPDAKEYKEAQVLMKEVSRREAEINSMALAVARDVVADQMEKRLLSQGIDATVAVSGSNKTTITFTYVLFSRPLVYKLTNETDFLQDLRAAGFKRVVFSTGYGTTWTYDL